MLFTQLENKMQPTHFQTNVLSWFSQHGRKDLPWQQHKTPYRVWVSEIMLQQTQVNTVIPYFLRFIERFPTIQILADAAQDDVLHLWTGLGYYNRARNLQRTAQIITEAYQGQFPSEQQALEELPGIGRSTAGAIRAIAFEQPAAILDGNVKRVLTRFHGIQEWPGERKTHDKLWALTEKYTPLERTADYTQAMMDIGATVCVRGKPHCEKCPLQTHCLAHAQGMEKSLPRPKPRKTLPVRQAHFLILQKDNSVFLMKRPPTGIWGSLWSLPEMSIDASLDDIQRYCGQMGCDAQHITKGESFRHTFSHFHLDITPVFIRIKKVKSKIMEDDQQIWYNLREPAIVGLPAPVKSLLSKLP
jgi:A/G-specific adenine glycosylase